MVEDEVQTRKRRRQTWDVGPAEQVEADDKARPPAKCRPGSPPKRDDDRDGHYVFSLGENLTPRYKILGKMGEGTFGRVLECWDRQTREYVAVKVVRSIRKYRDAAMIEVDVLQQLAKNEIGLSLYLIFYRLPYLTDMHDLSLIHTDLKPENILLVSSDYVKLPGYKRISPEETHFRCLPKSSAIKLIDFGSTAYDKQNHSSIVSTRHYRAPEVILGLGWSFPCDIWSIGCILVELCSVSPALVFFFPNSAVMIWNILVIYIQGMKILFQGEMLFQTHENLEHLAMMERVLGPFPDHMIRRANRGAEKYFRRSRLNWPEGAVSRESIKAVKKLDRLKNMLSQYAGYPRSSLVDLLHGLLEFDPSKRLTARQALDHQFFRIPT
ncbi:hypothetical protein RJ639_005359 [Escallonia herrerae]|uniref:Protein kinase domain-containing protein n=1 Tax=Escallonia herrerae TaxID=1293975 RepID=A0AA89AYP6_9ASTE|nr:hypothetical protein RJ639_005359 [Escallonia herrerae]